MIANETVNKVNAVMEIVDVVSTFMALKKRGVNYIAPCPFHNEKTGSFTVSPAKQMYKCFGCGKSGNAITFVMEYEKCDYPEAIRKLAAKYNIEFTETYRSEEEKQAATLTQSLKIIYKAATEYFTERLQTAPFAKDYLLSRSLVPGTLTEFGLGYNPSQPGDLYKHLRYLQFSDQLIGKSGLATFHSVGAFDFFRDRIMFPVHNVTGQVVGFAGRVIRNDDTRPKYINSSENELFIKGNLLYGLNLSRKAIVDQDEAIMMEGYLDVISLFQAGIKNVIATCGTSITDQQIKLIGRYTKNIILIYDGDAAGLKAVRRSLEAFMKEGFNVRVAIMLPGHDPDSYVRTFGADPFREFIKDNAQSIVGYYADACDLTDIKVKGEVFKELIALISQYNDDDNPFRKRELFDEMAEVFNVAKDYFNKYLTVKTLVPAPAQTATTEVPVQSELELAELQLTRYLLQYGDQECNGQQVFELILKELPAGGAIDYTPNPITQYIHRVYQESLQDGTLPDVHLFGNATSPDVASFVASAIMDEIDVSPTVQAATEKILDKSLSNTINKAIGTFNVQLLIFYIRCNQQDVQGKILDEVTGAKIDKALKEQLNEVSKQYNITNFKF